jgi:hypothetical protein
MSILKIRFDVLPRRQYTNILCPFIVVKGNTRQQTSVSEWLNRFAFTIGAADSNVRNRAWFTKWLIAVEDNKHQQIWFSEFLKYFLISVAERNI